MTAAPARAAASSSAPTGIAVTNNHVVTGAATLEVFVGGDLDDSYKRQECSACPSATTSP